MTTNDSAQTLLDAAIAVLHAASPEAKTAAAGQADALRLAGACVGGKDGETPSGLPTTPARPETPRLAPPSQMPKRRLGSPEGRAAMLHAVAHIEFNAIDLAFDMAARFSTEISGFGLDGDAFTRDWVQIGGEEARHFTMITKRLGDLGCTYGDHPAHNGLWEAAEATHHSALARLAIAPLILEARGLDVTPEMIKKLRSVGDSRSVDVLEVIYSEEIGHVACGKRWFDAICRADGLDPASTFHEMKNQYFAGQLKPPFNHDARQKAGLPKGFYERTEVFHERNGNQKGVKR